MPAGHRKTTGCTLRFLIDVNYRIESLLSIKMMAMTGLLVTSVGLFYIEEKLRKGYQEQTG